MELAAVYFPALDHGQGHALCQDRILYQCPYLALCLYLDLIQFQDQCLDHNLCPFVYLIQSKYHTP